MISTLALAALFLGCRKPQIPSGIALKDMGIFESYLSQSNAIQMITLLDGGGNEMNVTGKNLSLLVSELQSSNRIEVPNDRWQMGRMKMVLVSSNPPNDVIIFFASGTVSYGEYYFQLKSSVVSEKLIEGFEKERSERQKANSRAPLVNQSSQDANKK